MSLLAIGPASARPQTSESFAPTAAERAWLAEHPVVRIAPNPSYQPLDFLDENGEHTGFAGSYFARLAELLGIRFEIVRPTAEEQRLGDPSRIGVDVLPLSSSTDARREHWLYTAPYFTLPTRIYVRDEVSVPLELEALAGMRVAVVEGYAAREVLARTHPRIQLDLVPDTRTGLRKLDIGMVDALISDPFVAEWWMERDHVDGLHIAGDTGIDYELATAVRADWPELHGLLQRALASIGEKERARIHNRWIPLEWDTPGALTFLGVRDDAPFASSEGGRPVGSDVELARALAESFGRVATVRLYERDEAERRFRAGEGDALFGIPVASESGERYLTTQPTRWIDLSLFVRTGEARSGSRPSHFERIATPARGPGVARLEELRHPGIRPVENCVEGFELLLSDRVDAVLANRQRAFGHLREANLAGFEIIEPAIARIPVGFGLRPGDESLARDLDAALSHLASRGKWPLGLEPTVSEAATERPVGRRFEVQSWGIKEGLPQSSVTAIEQTPDGYLWLGTFGGLVRFDGVRMQVLSMATVPAFRSNRITALALDPMGQLWVGAQDGSVLRYDGERFEAMGDWTPRLVDFVREIVFDRDGRAIVHRGGLERLEGSKWRKLEEHDDLLWEAETSRDGALWYLDGEGRLVRTLAGTRATFERPERIEAGSKLISLEFDSSGQAVATATAGFLLRLEDGDLRLITQLPWPHPEIVGEIGDELWVRAGRALYVSPYSPESSFAPRFERVEGLDDEVRQVFRDREDNIWVGGNTTGLSLLRREQVELLRVGATQLPTFDAIGDLYYSQRQLLLRLEGDKPRYVWEITTPHSHVDSICPDPNGGLWIASSGAGVWRVENDQAVRVAKQSVPRAEAVTVGRGGRVWLAVANRVGYLRGEEFVEVTTAPAEVSVLHEARDGALWIGCRPGYMVWRDGEESRCPVLGDEQIAPIRAIHEDERGVIWLGTYGMGLIRHEGHRRARLTAENGLADDSVLAILETGDGYLWLNCNRGVQRIDRAALDEIALSGSGVAPGEYFGGEEGNGIQAGTVDEHGELWLATVEGLARLDPSNVRPNRVPPGVEIESILADGNPVPRTGRPEIPRGADVEIHFTGLSFANPRAMRFRYRLSGLDDRWRTVLGERVARFAGLRPGDYRFELMASNEFGVWSERVAGIGFTVPPAFYQRTSFLMLCAGLVAGLVLGAHSWRLRRIDRVNRELEQRIGERTEELRAANRELEAFTYTVSHDLRAPLRHINYYASRYLGTRLDELGPEVREGLEGMLRSSRRMSRLIDDLLMLSRLARKAVSRETIETVELVEDVWRELVRAAGDPRIELVLGPLPDASADERLLRHVWSNLLGNAIKYSASSKHPIVRVSGWSEDGRRWFRVQDNGVGFDPEYSAKLFAPFERLHSEEEFPGSGVGLAIAYRMVAKHGGEIRGSGAPGVGATFEFTVDPRSLTRTDDQRPSNDIPSAPLELMSDAAIDNATPRA